MGVLFGLSIQWDLRGLSRSLRSLAESVACGVIAIRRNGGFVVATINVSVYSDALIVLGTAGILVPVLRRWRLNPILCYLGAGALLGPLGLGSLIDKFPPLYWLTIVDADNIAGIAELGVVFLFFLIGLELSPQRLVTMRHLVAGMGSLQVVLTAALFTVIALKMGQDSSAAIVLGASLSLSSTAIVLELLSKQGRMSTSVGRASFALLLAQDIAVIPILMFISIGAGTSPGISHGSVLASLVRALVQAAVALVIIVVLGRVLMSPLFRVVAAAKSSEIFIAAVLFVIVSTGLIAHQAGLSMALGAFVAGLLLAETEFRKAIQTTVEPFKGLLLGIFFFTVGMKIDVRELMRYPVGLLASVLGLIAAKAIIITGLTRLFRFSWPNAIETGLLLGPGGEFAFVGIGMATTVKLVNPGVSSYWLAVTAVTMAATPVLSMAAQRLNKVYLKNGTIDPELLARPAGKERHAIVIGYGRVGKVVCSILRQHRVPNIAIDNDPFAVVRDRHEGHEVFYGDASNREFLKACGLEDATGVILTIDAGEVIDGIVAYVHAIRPDIPVITRARDAIHARHLYSIGATDAVPETIEASLQLSEAALLGLGVAPESATASVHEKRNEFRHELQDARRNSVQRQG